MNIHLLLAHFPKITYARHKKIVTHFLNKNFTGEIEFNDLCAAGWEPEIAHEFLSWRDKNQEEKIYSGLTKNNIAAITIDDPEYPYLLKQITDPPWVLFVRGTLPKNSEKQLSISVIGTRHYSLYGKETCVNLSNELAKRKIIIVSGLALGLDSIAHQAALNQNSITIAVLGGGIDRSTVAPRSHENLSERIIQSGGALVSEYPPGTEPTRYSFPARDRIIAGLTQGTLVIEARERSGALITARRALDYNREVMAVPHPINSISGAGGNELIKKGAALITSIDDICEVLSWQNISSEKTISPKTTNAEETKILAYFSHEPRQLESIIQSSGLPSKQVLVTLTLLEMRGIIKNIGGGYYTKG